MYTFITEEKDKNYNNIEIKDELNKIQYIIKLVKIKEISFEKVNDFNGTNIQCCCIFALKRGFSFFLRSKKSLAETHAVRVK